MSGALTMVDGTIAIFGAEALFCISNHAAFAKTNHVPLDAAGLCPPDQLLESHNARFVLADRGKVEDLDFLEGLDPGLIIAAVGQDSWTFHSSGGRADGQMY